MYRLGVYYDRVHYYMTKSNMDSSEISGNAEMKIFKQSTVNPCRRIGNPPSKTLRQNSIKQCQLITGSGKKPGGKE